MQREFNVSAKVYTSIVRHHANEHIRLCLPFDACVNRLFRVTCDCEQVSKRTPPWQWCWSRWGAAHPFNCSIQIEFLRLRGAQPLIGHCEPSSVTFPHKIIITRNECVRFALRFSNRFSFFFFLCALPMEKCCPSCHSIVDTGYK